MTSSDVVCDPSRVVEFSEQQLVDCDHECTDGDCDAGCNGGLMVNAFKFYQSTEACFETNYPYDGQDLECRQETCYHDSQRITDYYQSLDQDPEDIYDNLYYLGVHSIAVDASSMVFQFFSDGVINSDSCGTSLNHGVLLVGYIATDNAWKVKNSWGADWGSSGYVYIEKSDEVGPGFCGVNMDISRPNL